MAKRQYVTKLHKQHTSIVTSIPIMVRLQLDVTKGDHFVWTVDENSDFVQISKVATRGNENVKSDENST